MPRTEENKIIREMSAERLYSKINSPPQRLQIILPVKITLQPDIPPDRVQPCIRKLRIPVGKMRQRHSRKQANPWRQPPAQIKININISIHLRTDNRVGRIIIRVISLPPRGQPEIPFVMQRQPRS